MATAAHIAKRLEIEKVKINYVFFESLEEDYYSENPIPHLEFNTKSAEELDQVFGLQGIKFEDTQHYKQEIHQMYPESEQQLSLRKQIAVTDSGSELTS